MFKKVFHMSKSRNIVSVEKGVETVQIEFYKGAKSSGVVVYYNYEYSFEIKTINKDISLLQDIINQSKSLDMDIFKFFKELNKKHLVGVYLEDVKEIVTKLSGDVVIVTNDNTKYVHEVNGDLAIMTY